MSLPFGLTPSTIKPGAVRNMTSDKLATFSLGGTKKTPFQKHKEALEAKRKKEEEQLAAEHAQWISDFEEPSGTKRFVKGDTINHGNVGGGSSGSGGGGRGSSQPPASKPPNAAVQSMFGQDDDIDGEDIDGEEIGKAAPSSSSMANSFFLTVFSWVLMLNSEAFFCSFANLFSYLETFFRVGFMNFPLRSLTAILSSLI